MPLSSLKFKPGVNTEFTSYSNEGGWKDCDKVRFRFGFPEKLGGWIKFSLKTFLGTCRSLHAWVALDGAKFLGVGTHKKFYIEEGGTFNDVTPIRKTTTNAATFAATNGSTTITVTDSGHEAIVGDFVTFSGAATLGGNITAAILNIEYEIVTVPTANTYTITTSVAANSSDSGNGGGSVVAKYQISVGIDTVVPGTGWGAGTWGRGTWGSAATTVAGGGNIRIFTQDNFGEDLIFNIVDGSIYYWDRSGGLTTRAVELSTLDTNAPTVAKKIIVSDRDRHVLAFGTNVLGSSTQDKLLIRFSSQENPFDWNPTATNTAGDLLVGTGSQIVTAVETRREIIVLTDTSVHSLQFIGPPFIFGLTQISLGSTIIGPNAAVAVNDAVFWMGNGRFYLYDGSLKPLACTVRDTVFDDFNYTQGEQVVAGVNSEFGEIFWFYPSASASVNDKYVIYNYDEKVWYFGSLARTAWIDRGINEFPIAAGTTNLLFNHESGQDDDGSALSAFIESSPVEIGDGDQFSFIRRLVPDIDFLDSPSTADRSATFTLKAEDFPGKGFVRTTATTVNNEATQNHIRLRGRSVGVRVETSNQGVTWRLGTSRVDIQPDGRR
jgi:hypothetical protein